MSIETLSILTPSGCNLTGSGRGTSQGITAADVSAALMDCTPLQQAILLAKSGCQHPTENDIKSLHVRVCKMMVKHDWKISRRDSKRKVLLLLTRLCFYTYCSNAPVTIAQQGMVMGVSRSQYHKKWRKRFETVMDDFGYYLAQQEVIGISKYYNRANSS